MADLFTTVTPPDLPALTQTNGSELVAVWRDGRLGKMPQRDLRGTKTFSGAGGPPYEASRLFTMQVSLNDRWRDTTTRDEYKLTVLDPITWVFDGNVGGGKGEKGDPGAGISPKGQFATTADLPSMGLSGDLYVATADDTADPPAFLAGDGAMYVATGGTFGPGNKYRNIGPFRGPPGATTVDGLEDATLGFKALNVEDPAAPGNPVGDALAAKAQSLQPAAGFSLEETLADSRARYVAEHISVLDKRWAGGAKLNDPNFDNTPVVNAISTYVRTNTSKYFSSFSVYVPPGILWLNSGSWDVSGCHGMNILCAGRDATMIRSSGNFPVIRQIASTVNDSIVAFKIGPCTIMNSGYTGLSAHGIVLQAAYEGRIDCKFYGCRDCMQIATSWQIEIVNPRCDGNGILTNWNGLVQPDGIAGVAENAVIVIGGMLENCENYGVRGANITGSKYIVTEVTGAKNISWYLGDSPAGKDLKWFLMQMCLGDTGSDGLLAISRGNSQGVVGQFTIDNMWLGNCQSLGSTALLLTGVQEAHIGIGIAVSNDYSAIVRDCNGIAIKFGSISQYDRFNVGHPSVLLERTSYSSFHFGTIRAVAPGNIGPSIAETMNSNNNGFFGFVADRPVLTLANNGSYFCGIANGTPYGMGRPA